MATDLLAGLLNAVGLNNQKLQASSDVAQDIQSDQRQAMADQLTDLNTANSNSLIVKQAQVLADQKAEQDTAKFATTLGTNPDSSTEIMTGLAKEWQAATQDAITKRKALQENLDTKFLDHPVDWVYAQLTQESTIKAADAANQRQQGVQTALTFAQNQTQQAAVTANALKQTKTDAAVQAELESTKATLDANTQQVRINNAGINLRGIKELNDITLQQLNNLSTGYSAQTQAAHLGLAYQQFALTKKSTELQMVVTQDALDQKKLDRSDLADLASTVKKGAATLGYTDAAAFPDNKIIQLLNMKDDKYLNFLRVGMNSGATGYPVISDNAGEAAKLVVQTSAPMRPEQTPIKNLLKDSWTQAAGGTQGIGPDGKKFMYDNTKVDQVTRATQNIALQNARGQMNNIKPGDSSNIYAPPPLPQVFEIPAIKNSIFGQKVLAPQMAAGGLQEFNVDTIVGLTVKAIKSGDISYNDAVTGLQGTFNGAVALNNRTKNYVGFGLPPQMGYRTQVPNGFGWNKKVDLSTQQDVSNLLNSTMSSEQRTNQLMLESTDINYYRTRR